MKLSEATFQPDVNSIAGFVKRLHPDDVDKDEDSISFTHYYKGGNRKQGVSSVIHFTPKGYYYEGGTFGTKDKLNKKIKATTNSNSLFKEIQDWLWEMNVLN